jgi:hypothetical protein
MVAVPAVKALTVPFASTVATVLLLLAHTPPVVALLNVVVVPAVMLVAPLMLAGVAGAVVTVTIFVTWLLPHTFVATILLYRY